MSFKYKVKVNGLAEQIEAVDIFKSMGFVRKMTNNPIDSWNLVVVDGNGEILFSSIKASKSYDVISLNQLRAMAKKEYLDENYNLVHHKTDIEVPEGAEIYTLNSDSNVFYKTNSTKYLEYFSDNKWRSTKYCHVNFMDEMLSLGRTVVWQRTPSVDNVNQPAHYTSGAVECIDAIEASMSEEAFKGFLKGNVQKYTWRYEQKGGVESLEKAQWYLNLLLSRVRS